MGTPFFTVIVHIDDTLPDLHGLCAGFECGEWRKDQLVEHLFDNYLPEFALSYSESQDLSLGNIVSKMKRAVAYVYQSEKFKSRGEFGELLLHAIIREIYETIPAISKIYYKDRPNDTVKGFDAVHVVLKDDDSLELWLGEAKFYESISGAIADVVEELYAHTERNYIRNEFIAITNKVNAEWPYADKLKSLLHPNTSLDEVFERICIPVLLTYDSDVLKKHDKTTEEYIKDIGQEFRKVHERFCKRLGDFPLTVHLFLLPLNTKEDLIKSLNDKLQAWQNI